MKNISLKWKLTVLYTVLMTIVVCMVLGILFSLSNQEILSTIQITLKERVSGSFDDIKYEDGKLDFDSDILELEDNIYLSVYDENGNFLYGKIPYGFNQKTAFSDGEIQDSYSDKVRFYVFDMTGFIEGYGMIYIRGITSVTEAERSFLITVQFAVFFLPLLVALAGILGYFMTKKAFEPVGRITETVREIYQKGDLSKRVGLESGRDELYQMAATFDLMLERVEQSIKREQQFTSDVSHELRTPVSVIRMQCEELLTESVSREETREGIEVIDKKIRYISRMISQLLLLSRADQGREKLVMESLDFSMLTEMAAEETREQARERNMTVVTEIEQGIDFYGDETLLIRMWMNLLNNAVVYGKEGGTIRVTLKKENGKIVGMVQDDGIGISQKDLPHIWERFYQADSSRTSSDSAGLGLSMVQWIVRVHGGTIDVESVPEKGSSFIFQFPK